MPYGPFQAGDGGTVFLSVQNEREFARFCERVLGRARRWPRIRASLRRRRALQNRDAMHAEIEKVFSGPENRSRSIERLEEADIANAR